MKNPNYLREPSWVINRNGNTPNDIRDDYYAMHEAAQKLLNVMQEVYANSMHSRNYQTHELADSFREADINRFTVMMHDVADIRDHAVAGAARAIAQREGL